MALKRIQAYMRDAKEDMIFRIWEVYKRQMPASMNNTLLISIVDQQIHDDIRYYKDSSLVKARFRHVVY